MGGQGSGRKITAEGLLRREAEKRMPIAKSGEPIYLPNHSGIKSHTETTNFFDNRYRLASTTIDISDDTNLTAGTGITLTDDTISTNDSEIVHDNLSGFVAAEHIDWTSTSSNLNTSGTLTGDTLTITNASQDYIIQGRSNALSFQAQSSANACNVDWFSKDGDGTDNINISIWGVGTPSSTTNRERSIIGYSNGGYFFLQADANGTGTSRAITLFTDSHGTDQLWIATDGTVGVNTTSPAGKFEVQTETTDGVPAITIDQNDPDQPFLSYEGTFDNTETITGNITTLYSGGTHSGASVSGPKESLGAGGWNHEGMVLVKINSTDYWMPYYSHVSP